MDEPENSTTRQDAAGNPPGQQADRAATGIEGLDDVLGGGFPRHRMHLIQGAPGSGKTTLGLQFLMEGARLGERTLCMTFSESAEELQSSARTHGWGLEGVVVEEMSASDQLFPAGSAHTIFHPSEIELTETTNALIAAIEQAQPERIVFDSLSELRLMAGDPLRYRRQILLLKQYFAGRQCTVLVLDDVTSDHDEHLRTIAHSIVKLEQVAMALGPDRRRLRIEKMRGARFRGGYHDFSIETGGLSVHPRLVAAEHRVTQDDGQLLSSGLPALDGLLGGGLDVGSATLLVGPAGAGKSVVATLHAVAAADRGMKSAMYLFDERLQSVFARSRGLGIDLESHARAGLIDVQPVDPAELSPGAFEHVVRRACDDGAKLILIDSLNGYLNSMLEQRLLTVQFHELLTYLGHRGVTTIMTVAQHGLFEPSSAGPVDVSYLTDNVVLFRYFEHAGAIRQAMSVFKRRGGAHERTLRELRLGPPKGVEIGPPLTQFEGILTGVPRYTGDLPESSRT